VLVAGAWSAVTVSVAVPPCCTVVVPVNDNCGTSLDLIVTEAEAGAPIEQLSPRPAVQPERVTVSVLSGSTRPFALVKIWIWVDVTFGGKVNGPDGVTTSVELFALPLNVTENVSGLVGAGFAFTMNVAGCPFATIPVVGVMVNTGAASVPTSPDFRKAVRTALALVVDAAAFTSGGGPMVSPADVWSPSL
jgi:hypothetical protein